MYTNKIGLYDLTKWFLFTLVGFNKDNFDTRVLSVFELIDKVTNYVPTKLNGSTQWTKIVNKDQLSELLTLKLNLSDGAIKEIMTHVIAISTKKATIVANSSGGILQWQTLTHKGLIELKTNVLPEGVTVTENDVLDHARLI